MHYVQKFRHNIVMSIVSTPNNPFCTSIITSNQITREYSDDIIIKNGQEW